MRLYSHFAVVIGFGLLLSLACASGSTVGAGPVAPTPVLTSESPVEPASAGHYLWGYWQVSVDPATLECEIVPLRLVEGHWNVLQFLEQAPCKGCFKFKGVSPNPDGTLNVDISVKHPFANKNLTGFDVRGIAMFNGSREFPASGLTFADRTLGDGAVVNADGYTTLYNPTTLGSGQWGMEGYFKGKWGTIPAPNAVLNPFKRFVSDGPANTRNAFYAGDEVVVTYQIDMPDSPNPWVFGYAIDACWAPPIHKPVDDPMTDFGPEANCPEAWKIGVADTPIGDGLTDCGGQVSVAVDVYDWQGKDDAHPVVVECPELFDGQVEATWKADGVGFITYEAVVENAKNAPVGTYRCLVSKEAQENDPLKSWLDITAYRLHELEVVAEIKETPTAVLEASQPSAYVGEAISFDASGSHDNDCGNQSIVKYEWDWENSGAWVEGGAQVDHSWSTSGIHHVQLRVTDDEAQTDTLDEPLEIVTFTESKVPPVAIATADPLIQDAGQPIHFSDDGSYDPDGGSIVKYEWDWDNDGTYDEEGIEADHSWSTAGIYHVQLRVTDDEAQTDTLDEPLEITINAVKVPPVAIATAAPLIQNAGQPVHFSDDGSYDPDGGLIVKYEWDWDNNGTYDEEGAEADHSWSTPGIYLVQLRVTDDEAQTDTLDEPLEITINVVTVPPVAVASADPLVQNAGQPIHFSGNGSYDPDGGLIVKYEWDWESDGTYDEEGIEVDHSWPTEGKYHVQLRVTDDEAQTDKLDQPLEIIISNGGYPFNLANVTPPWLNFTPEDICAVSNYAYVAGGANGLHIFNISDPENPVWINRVDTSGFACEVVVSGGYAYVADHNSGLQIIDIEPPESAYVVKSVDTPYSAQGVAVSGGYAYVADWSNLQIIDIDPPASAYIVKSVNTSGLGGEALGVAVSGSYAYVVGDWPVLYIIDIETPESAYITKSVDTPGNAYGVSVSGGYAYVAAAHSGLQIIDVDPPESAYIVKSVNTPGETVGVEVSGGYAYVADGALEIIDIDPPESAYIANSVYTPGSAVRVAVSGSYAYVADWYSGFQTIDIDPPESAYVVNSVYTPGYARGVAISGGYACVADGYSGLQIIDIDPPESAYIFSSVDTPNSVRGVAVSGGYAYVADYDSGLHIIDIDPPGSASIANTVDTPGYAFGVEVSGGYAYVADYDSGLQIIDIDPPESAYIANTVDTPGHAFGVAISGGYAYVADYDSGLQIIDIDPPESAYIVKSVDTSGHARGVAVSGGYAYVADEESGLQIIDIDPPESAYIVKSVDTSGYVEGVAVSEGYAYVADDFLGFKIIDVDPPESAHGVESVSTPGEALGVAISGGYAYFADAYAGLRIIKLW